MIPRIIININFLCTHTHVFKYLSPHSYTKRVLIYYYLSLTDGHMGSGGAAGGDGGGGGGAGNKKEGD